MIYDDYYKILKGLPTLPMLFMTFSKSSKWKIGQTLELYNHKLRNSPIKTSSWGCTITITKFDLICFTKLKIND
jgi:hypothetical protein